MKRQLIDDPVDLSLHCTGLVLLIAYSDRLQLLYILRCAQAPAQTQPLHSSLHSGSLPHCGSISWAANSIALLQMLITMSMTDQVPMVVIAWP